MTVLQLVKTFEKVTGSAVPYKITERRVGDITAMFANVGLAEQELNWKAKHTLEEMCMSSVFFLSIKDLSYFKHLYLGIDFWRWQTMNPYGYRNQKLTKVTNGH